VTSSAEKRDPGVQRARSRWRCVRSSGGSSRTAGTRNPRLPPGAFARAFSRGRGPSTRRGSVVDLDPVRQGARRRRCQAALEAGPCNRRSRELAGERRQLVGVAGAAPGGDLRTSSIVKLHRVGPPVVVSGSADAGPGRPAAGPGQSARSRRRFKVRGAGPETANSSSDWIPIRGHRRGPEGARGGGGGQAVNRRGADGYR